MSKIRFIFTILAGALLIVIPVKSFATPVCQDIFSSERNHLTELFWTYLSNPANGLIDTSADPNLAYWRSNKENSVENIAALGQSVADLQVTLKAPNQNVNMLELRSSSELTRNLSQEVIRNIALLRKTRRRLPRTPKLDVERQVMDKTVRLASTLLSHSSAELQIIETESNEPRQTSGMFQGFCRVSLELRA